MSRLKLLLPMVALVLAACASSPVDAPYDFCASGDSCSNATVCIATTLPLANSGFFCSNFCNNDNDCLQDTTNFATICVNQACYITCPTSGNNCPYSSSCADFTDSNTGDIVSLCTP
jgi:hypothetical protein